MQKTGWSTHSSQQPFHGVWGHFGMVTKNKQANKQPGDPRARLLFTTKKAVFCKLISHICLALEIWCFRIYGELDFLSIISVQSSYEIIPFHQSGSYHCAANPGQSQSVTVHVHHGK